MTTRAGTRISVVAGDITRLVVDAIVNAANGSLLGGGGVDGAIHRAAGPALKEECRQLNGCQTGEAKITRPHGIKQVAAIIHVVGPRIDHNDEPDEDECRLLQSCYENAFRLAKKHGLRSIAFPCISTGVYNFPNVLAARIAMSTTKAWLEDSANADTLDRVVFCVFLDRDERIYKKLSPLCFDAGMLEREGDDEETAAPGDDQAKPSGIRPKSHNDEQTAAPEEGRVKPSGSRTKSAGGAPTSHKEPEGETGTSREQQGAGQQRGERLSRSDEQECGEELKLSGDFKFTDGAKDVEQDAEQEAKPKDAQP